jgi:hypothetical protein
MQAMTKYVVTQDASRFEVRVGDANGRVVATFSNRLAAETFAEKQRALDEGAANIPSEDRLR